MERKNGPRSLWEQGPRGRLVRRYLPSGAPMGVMTDSTSAMEGS